MKIALDIMGGDFAPLEAIKGVQLFFDEYQKQDVHLLLIGNAEAANNHLHLLDTHKSKFTFVEAPEVIGMNEHPTKALKEKQNSSIAIGFGMLQAQKADALIGVGNTGAMMVGAMYSVKNIDGVQRPTIATPIPRADGSGVNLVLDVGLNADCKPENLQQFALLGSMYMKHIEGIENPKVGLLNIGEEEGKGNILTQATYALLKEDKDINFIGNVEGRSVFSNDADVIVCEGFVGNVLLKTIEAMEHIMSVQQGISNEFIDSLDYERYGGIPILGINNTVIVGHGISKATAFKNMIDVASKNINANLPEKLKTYFSNSADS